VGQEIVRQVNFNAGELDPRVDGRQDLKVYFAGLERAENVVALPVGPLVRRPGTEFIDYARHVLLPVAFDTTMVQTPDGESHAGILAADGTLYATTVDLGAADQVIVQFDFGAAVEVHLIDLIDYGAKEGGGGATPDPVEPPFTYPWPNGNFGGVDSGVFEL
jgi:hypothetical protein